MHTAGIFDIPGLRPLGRFHPETARRRGVLPLLWPGSGAELHFTGGTLSFLLEADFETHEPWIAAAVDGAPMLRMPLNRGLNEVCVFRGMGEGRCRRVQLCKETQPTLDDPRQRLWLRGLCWEGGDFLPMPGPALRMEFIGDSLTSGEGLAGAREETAWVPAVFSASRTWAMRTAELLGAEPRLISQSGWGLRSGWDNNPNHALPDQYELVCGPAGEEGAREPHDFAGWQPDAVIVNLGTNDANAMEISAWHGPGGARFKQEATAEGLRLVEDAAAAFLERLRRCNPCAKLVWAYGMADERLRAQLEGAVARYREETGDGEAYYLPLPAATEETLGSRRHPGPVFHEACARTTAGFLREIL